MNKSVKKNNAPLILISLFFLYTGVQQALLIGHITAEYRISMVPDYLLSLMGYAKVLAIIGLWSPLPKKWLWLKEWAFAGLVFLVIGGAYSHIYLQEGLYEVVNIIVLLLGIVFRVHEFRKQQST